MFWRASFSIKVLALDVGYSELRIERKNILLLPTLPRQQAQTRGRSGEGSKHKHKH